MENALAEGPGARTEFLSFASFSSPVPAGQSLSSRKGRRLGVAPGVGVEVRRGSEAARLGPLGQTPALSGERKLFSLQVQEVFSQVLTHNNSEQGEECGAGKGREKGKAGAVVVLRNQRPQDAWPRAGPAPGLGGRGSGAPR